MNKNKSGIMAEFKQWCTPATVYFVFSMLVLIVVSVQNITGSPTTLHIGSVKTIVPNVLLVLILKFIYILFWTWILNLICKDGYPSISWLIILIPFFISLMMLLFTVN